MLPVVASRRAARIMSVTGRVASVQLGYDPDFQFASLQSKLINSSFVFGTRTDLLLKGHRVAQRKGWNNCKLGHPSRLLKSRPME